MEGVFEKLIIILFITFLQRREEIKFSSTMFKTKIKNYTFPYSSVISFYDQVTHLELELNTTECCRDPKLEIVEEFKKELSLNKLKQNSDFVFRSL